MADGLTGAPVHAGSWFGLPDFGVTEWLQGQKTTTPSPTGLKNSDGTPAAVPNVGPGTPLVLGAVDANANGGVVPPASGTAAPPGDSRLTQLEKIGSARNPKEEGDYQELIRQSAASQEEAARKAAEARRQAAQRSYEGKVAAAGVAKDNAKGQYDWIIDTLGSNKKDLLDSVALNETTGVQDYQKQEGDTKTNYDKSRQEILSTYRDLQKEQEKILRGTGVSSSSRSQEAQLRLNNLMGKDLSETSKGEADSLALIGNALTTFKSKIQLTKNTIENETKSKLDKAALDYDQQVKAIDANTNLAANEREDAYAAAEVQLANDTAGIQSWAAGLQLQAAQTLAKTKESLDNFVVDMTDSQKLLAGTLDEKKAATDAFIQSIPEGIQLDQEGGLTTPTQGIQRSPTNKSLASRYTPEGLTPEGLTTGAAGASEDLGLNITQKAKSDPLLSAIFG